MGGSRVRGQGSEVRGQRSGVRGEGADLVKALLPRGVWVGQGSEVRGQRSGVRVLTWSKHCFPVVFRFHAIPYDTANLNFVCSPRKMSYSQTKCLFKGKDLIKVIKDLINYKEKARVPQRKGPYKL